MAAPRAIRSVLAASVLGAAAAAAGSGMFALETLGRALRQTPVWRAEYTQEYVPAGLQSGELVRGAVRVAWPDRARFDTGDPVSQMMGLEGRLVRLVDLEVPSCDEHLLGDDEWARIPLAAVLDPGGAVDRFTVLDHGERGFILVPREPGGVDRVEVALGAGGLPEEVVIVDPQGAVNRLRFTDWSPADVPEGGTWLPDPPPGLDCIRDN